ncbi:hypothetical protein [Listeria sp. ILCC792]|uniref:hypothetical protein n=1 Tax=Listeria sp. ILCC792 TaxID=1918331 RepID=UPI000B590254|nr:hypothetical protein [Listeria sp. ILCC792]
MKNILLVLMAALLSVGLTACGDEPKAEEKTKVETKKEPKKTKKAPEKKESTIVEPSAKQVTTNTDGSYQISGTATPKATINLDDVKVIADDNGKFTIKSKLDGEKMFFTKRLYCSLEGMDSSFADVTVVPNANLEEEKPSLPAEDLNAIKGAFGDMEALYSEYTQLGDPFTDENLDKLKELSNKLYDARMNLTKINGYTEEGSQQASQLKEAIISYAENLQSLLNSTKYYIEDSQVGDINSADKDKMRVNEASQKVPQLKSNVEDALVAFQ